MKKLVVFSCFALLLLIGFLVFRNLDGKPETTVRKLEFIDRIDEIVSIEISKMPSPPTTHITESQELISDIVEYVNRYEGRKIKLEPYGGWEVSLTVYYQDHTDSGCSFSSGRISNSSGEYFLVGDHFREQLLAFYEQMEPVQDGGNK